MSSWFAPMTSWKVPWPRLPRSAPTPLSSRAAYHPRSAVEAALKHRLPAFSNQKSIALAGALTSYSASNAERARGIASYVDRILKGAKPGDLPVQQPSIFELVINLKTAKALGVTIPATLMARADEVIE